MISLATVGGILLIIGASFMYVGDVKKSILTYFVADICWVILGYQNNDIIGMITISVGMILGFLVFLKMHTGIFRSTLKK